MKKSLYIISLALTVLFFVFGGLNLYGSSYLGIGEFMVLLAFVMLVTYILSIILTIKDKNWPLFILFLTLSLILVGLVFGLAAGGL